MLINQYSIARWLAGVLRLDSIVQLTIPNMPQVVPVLDVSGSVWEAKAVVVAEGPGTSHDVATVPAGKIWRLRGYAANHANSEKLSIVPPGATALIDLKAQTAASGLTWDGEYTVHQGCIIRLTTSTSVSGSSTLMYDESDAPF